MDAIAQSDNLHENATSWSVAHISPLDRQPPEIEGGALLGGHGLVCDVYADMLHVRPPGTDADDYTPPQGDSPTPGGKRGAIVGFSRASRLRLLRLLASCRQTPAAFVTLTYPDDYPQDWQVFKRHLDTMIKRIKRRIPGCLGLWKLEPQKRGAPHYHIMIWAAPGQSNADVLRLLREAPTPDDSAWIADAWVDVTGSGGGEGGWHYVYGATCEGLTSRKKAYAYLAKYMGKTDDDAPGTDADADPDDDRNGLFAWGRWWGRWGDTWDTSTSAAQGIALGTIVELKRLVRKWLKAQARQRKPRGAASLRRVARRLAQGHPAQGFTVLGLGDGGWDGRTPDPGPLLRLIDHAARLADLKPALAHRLASWGNWS